MVSKPGSFQASPGCGGGGMAGSSVMGSRTISGALGPGASLPWPSAMAVLDLLAPDQRAVVGLVLQQGRSYREIADLLGISRSAVRARAHAGLAALAPPDAEVPADEAAQLADFLLGQQDAPGAAATRELIADSSDARLWASTVAERLREVAPERVPDLDDAAAPASGTPAPRPRAAREAASAPTPRPRPAGE